MSYFVQNERLLELHPLAINSHRDIEIETPVTGHCPQWAASDGHVFPALVPHSPRMKLKIATKTKRECHSISLLSVPRGMADRIYVLSYASAAITSQVSLETPRQSENTKTTPRRRST